MRRLILVLIALLFAAPAAAAPHGTILIYSGTTGYRHESIPAGIAAVTKLAKARGLTVEASEDPSVFATDRLKRYRAIVLLSCTTDPKNPASEWLTGSRRDALQGFLRSGHGILAIHAAADSHYHWPWYSKMIGGHFARHPTGTPTGTVRTLATGETRIRTDEWYYFDDWDPTSHLLVTLDPTSIGEADVNPNPMNWTRKVEGGRVFYTAMGHTTASYSEPWFLKQLGAGLDWVLGGK
jgi:type 1 glutamine amidotransferase